jgi:tryptophan 2,3-dioxygenase
MPYEPLREKPILPGTADTDYERYLRTDELLALQKTKEQRNHPDELLFQVVHQSSELMMKSAIDDLERAMSAMDSSDLNNTARLIARANKMLDHPIGLMHMLEMLTPRDYHVIRAGLGHGSGLDSPGFLGLLHLAPRLYESFTAAMREAKVTIDDVYRGGFKEPRTFGFHQIAEAMLDFDERLQLFRFHHLKLAQRIIGGGVIGTGGMPMDLLRQRQEHIFFKSLWEVRTRITEEVNAKRDEKATGHGEVER